MISFQTVVRETSGQRRTGIVCPAAPGMEDEAGVSVVFPPSTVSEVFDEDTVETIGPENAVADMEKCGAGRSKETCMYLVVADGAPACTRFSGMRWTVFFALRARCLREPTEAFPACQLFSTED